MNKIIKEMAVKADGYWEHGDHNMPTTVCFHEDDLVKFAESLIRECARVADLADDNNCEWIGGNILTHFGVK